MAEVMCQRIGQGQRVILDLYSETLGRRLGTNDEDALVGGACQDYVLAYDE